MVRSLGGTSQKVRCLGLKKIVLGNSLTEIRPAQCGQSLNHQTLHTFHSNTFVRFRSLHKYAVLIEHRLHYARMNDSTQELGELILFNKLYFFESVL